MTHDEERRGEDRRSPVGDFLIEALARRGVKPLAYAELLQVAGDNGLNMSTVLAWVARAEEGGLVEQLTGPNGHGRSLLLTPQGAEIVRNNRRRVERRGVWSVPPDDGA